MIRFDKFCEDDIPRLTAIMKAAFDEDSRLHLNKPTGGPDGYDDGSFLRKWFMHPHATSYTIYEDDVMISSICLWIHSNQFNVLGCIFIDPAFENKGYGVKICESVENMYPDTICWRTETPIFSHRNHHFYINKLGFKCVKITNPKDYFEGQFKLEKYMKRYGQ